MPSNDGSHNAIGSRVAYWSGRLETATRAQARSALRELVRISDDGAALELAARFAPVAELSSDSLLQLWWGSAADEDGFAAAVLAPAFRREGRTVLRLTRMVTLTGLRHLTTLRKLELESSKDITDLTEIGALTGLTSLGLYGCAKVEDISPLAALTGLTGLDLRGCAKVEDLTPLSALTELTRLDLHRCRAVADTAPLLTLGRLRDLDLSMTRVTSVAGFGAAFPLLERLNLRGCRSFKTPAELSGLTRLTRLDLGWTGIRDLTGLADVPDLFALDLASCKPCAT
ncbi:leucine-rich repeat domain-containing protein [Streptomyces sp. ISL-12]|uniref:leucine-rich repeat domain-containing protein n=1 Tax=Streptomyces sp. ISL-12 TaxID=2819177 RepID=UPI0020358C5F|nr:leucine-rich repeat domain-containing protein [Streptomyces sp. ISL-12]